MCSVTLYGTCSFKLVLNCYGNGALEFKFQCHAIGGSGNSNLFEYMVEEGSDPSTCTLDQGVFLTPILEYHYIYLHCCFLSKFILFNCLSVRLRGC